MSLRAVRRFHVCWVLLAGCGSDDASTSAADSVASASDSASDAGGSSGSASSSSQGSAATGSASGSTSGSTATSASSSSTASTTSGSTATATGSSSATTSATTDEPTATTTGSSSATDGDECPDDPLKTTPGLCGCGVPEGECPPDDCVADPDAAWNAVPTGGTLESGPLVGHVTAETAAIWAHAPAATEVEVLVQRLGSCPSEPFTVAAPPRAASNDSSLAAVPGLLADTPYRYRVIVDGLGASEGTFRTAPPAGAAGRFTYVFGSCARIQQHPNQPVWDDVLALQPAFMLLNGDTVYHDTTDYAAIWSRNLQQRGLANFAEVVANIPTYAGWDDHDYGQNNGDGTLANKGRALDAWTDLWANPGYGTPELAGTFYSFTWGDAEFFVVDNRYHRGATTYLGAEQMDWLLTELRASTAVFKIVAHGGTIRRAGPESWFERSAAERTALLNAIRDEGITGVVFHGGDVHQNWYNPYPRCPRAQAPHHDVFEIVSSGLTYARRYTTIEIDTTGAKPVLTYETFENNAQEAMGTITLEPDGTQRHDTLVLDDNQDDCQAVFQGPAVAFPQ
jgi:alkaline phosphatase D